ncbi:MAG: hypothetical protein WA880_00160 [Ornithinimicrobium sp.]
MSRSGREVVCSAKACRSTATHAVIWRNPKLHTQARRKVWTACADHVETLRTFVDLRGFLIEVIRVEDLQPDRDG